MTVQRKTLGKLGESLALKYLQDLGYKILVRNYQIRLGEVDIIAEDSGTLVFIEVKTRFGAGCGSPFEAVTPRKQRQLSKVALEYIGRKEMAERPARFDVVGVSFDRRLPPSEASAKVEVLRNAFDLCYGL